MGVWDWQGGSDAILFWNELALEAHRRDFTFTDADGEDETEAADDRRGLHPEHPGLAAASRIFAMVHLAIYDAWHGLAPTPGTSYLDHRASTPDAASAEAAVAGAALTVLSSLYGRQRDLFESKCREHFGMLSDAGLSAAAIATGYQYGRAVGLAIVDARTADGAAANGCYAPGTIPGLSRPDPVDPVPPQAAAWGDVKPFGIDTLAVLCNAIQPPWGATALGGFLSCDAYLRDLAEVADVGAAGPAPGRSAEQTVIGLFWAYDGARNIGTAPRLYNQCIRAISKECRLNPGQNALLFALANMAMADAAIAAWFGKYRFRVWRPIHGVREAAAGWGFSAAPAKATTADEPTSADIGAWLAWPGPGASTHVRDGWHADPFWRPFGVADTNAPGKRHRSPPSPAYPSAHSTIGTACFDVVFRFLRLSGMTAAAARRLGFTVVSDEFSGRATDAAGYLRPRHSRRLTLGQAIRENALARLYLGVNWRAAAVEGVRLGFAVASELASAGRGPAASLVGSSAVDALLPTPGFDTDRTVQLPIGEV
jgi:vanadium chloroperoxidase